MPVQENVIVCRLRQFIRIAPLLAFAVLNVPGQAQAVIPMVKGNRWTLTNPYVSSPFEIKVDDVQTLGPTTVATVTFGAPWGAYTLLLNVKSDGIYMDGYIADGVTYHVAVPVPYFLTNVPVGSTWTSPFGPLTLTQTGATVSGPAGTFSNASVYTMHSGSPAAYSWVLAPGKGFVRYGDGNSAFPLKTYLVSDSAPAPKSATSSACPVLGVSAIPRGATITPAMRKAAFSETFAAGSRFLEVNATWAELEPTDGVYALTRVSDEVSLAQQAGVPVMFTLKVTDSVASGVPYDLRSYALDSSTVLNRLGRLLTALKPVLTSQVKWINVGYETDIYLFYRQGEVNAFRTLFQSAAAKLMTLGNYSVGVSQSFDTFRTSDLIFKKIADLGTHLSFNYYGIGPDFVQRDPTAPLTDIPMMVAAAGGRPVIVGELGYSTLGVNGSLDKQAAFFSNALTALAKQPGTIAAASVWALRDVPQAQANTIAAGQALANDANFLAFLGSLGLQSETGALKPAWSIVTSRAGQFSSGSVCSTY